MTISDAPSLAASAESEATNLYQLPMSSLPKQSKRKSEALTIPARRLKKPRSDKAVSTSKVSAEVEENPGPSELGTFINTHGSKMQAHPPQPRVCGRFTSRSTPSHTPTYSFASVAAGEILRRPSILQNNSSLKVDVDAFTNFLNLMQVTANEDKVSKTSQASDFRAIRRDNVAPGPIAPAVRIAGRELENEQVIVPTGTLLLTIPGHFWALYSSHTSRSCDSV